MAGKHASGKVNAPKSLSEAATNIIKVHQDAQLLGNMKPGSTLEPSGPGKRGKPLTREVAQADSDAANAAGYTMETAKAVHDNSVQGKTAFDPYEAHARTEVPADRSEHPDRVVDPRV
jgi:hypothetical protein